MKRKPTTREDPEAVADRDQIVGDRDQTGADRDQTQADRDQAGADHDQTLSDRDRDASDRDQLAADQDQAASDRDQLAADQDQAASDRDLARGGDRTQHDETRAARARTARNRSDTADERSETALERDNVAAARDRAAAERDAAADARDQAAAVQDEELRRLLAGYGTQPAVSGQQIVLRAARERERANDARERAAAHRAEAARDRRRAAEDRAAAARDRAAAAAERHALALDALTGTWRREPGLEQLSGEIERARRGNGQLVLAYVDVNGLKVTNDRDGHRAGDALLSHVVETIRSHLRPYELIVRMGGDEFVCALSGATIGDVRRRFDEINRRLERSANPAAITVGFAALEADDSPADLVDRADLDFLAAHNTRLRDAQPVSSASASGGAGAPNR